MDRHYSPTAVMLGHNAKTQSLEGLPPGGIIDLQRVEMAGLCAGLDRSWWLALRARHGDGTVLIELADKLWIEAVDLNVRNRWTDKYKNAGKKWPKEMLRRMAARAVLEFSDGKQSRPEMWPQRCKCFEVTKASWFRFWKPIFDAIALRLENWYDAGAGEINRRQRGE